MAGRKRRISTLGECSTPEKYVNNCENKTNVSDPELNRYFCCENDQNVETARSRYFTENNPQRRLGDDFFNQPCISLAKALLGKVSQSSA